MKETFYFSHDYNTRSDPKIKRLLQKHGLLGYGIFWALVEDLYQNANALPTDYEGIAYDLRTECELVKSIVNDFGLFAITGEIFKSLSIERRLIERSEKSEKAKKSAEARWNKDKDANASSNNANASKNYAIKESKVKDIILNEIKENKEISKEILPSDISENILPVLVEEQKKEEHPPVATAPPQTVSPYGDGELHALCRKHNEESEIKYKPEMYKEFLLYWTAKVTNGKLKKHNGNEKWRNEETFVLALRLSTWAKNFNKSNNNGSYQNNFTPKPLGATAVFPANKDYSARLSTN